MPVLGKRSSGDLGEANIKNKPCGGKKEEVGLPDDVRIALTAAVLGNVATQHSSPVLNYGSPRASPFQEPVSNAETPKSNHVTPSASPNDPSPLKL